MEGRRFMIYYGTKSENFKTKEEEDRIITQDTIDIMFRIELLKDRIINGRKLTPKEDFLLDCIILVRDIYNKQWREKND